MYPGAPGPYPMPQGQPDFRALRLRPDMSPMLQQWQSFGNAPQGYQGVPMGYGSPLAPGSSNAFAQAPAFDGTGYNFAGIADPNRALRRIPDSSGGMLNRAVRRPWDF